tara:strand:- start:259 stop:447 length:189 start_codon:yes stop_codon:yes gene_type:complete
MEQKQITIEKMNEEIENLKKRFEKLEEDLEFSRRIEEAYQRHEAGDVIEMDGEEFLKEIKKW